MHDKMFGLVLAKGNYPWTSSKGYTVTVIVYCDTTFQVGLIVYPESSFMPGKQCAGPVHKLQRVKSANDTTYYYSLLYYSTCRLPKPRSES